jgi:hypothetical protein
MEDDKVRRATSSCSRRAVSMKSGATLRAAVSDEDLERVSGARRDDV